MGYSSAGFSAFLNAMTELRNQRLREELAEAQMQQENMQQMGKSIGGAFSSMSNMFGQMGKDQTANSIMNEMMPAPPRAGAVDVPWSDKLATEAPFYQGGTSEMDMRMKMANARQEQMRAQAYRDQVDFAKGKYLNNMAEKSNTENTKGLQKEFETNRKYINDMNALDHTMGTAKDPMTYDGAKKAKIALNQAGLKLGIPGVDPIDPATIPPFMTEQQKADLAAQQKVAAEAQQAVVAAQNAPQGLFDQWGVPQNWQGPLGAAAMMTGPGAIAAMSGVDITGDKRDAAIKIAQDKYNQEQSKLSEMQGSPPGAAGAPAATGATAGAKPSYPEGTVIVNESGVRMVKKNGQWVAVQ